MNEPKEYAWVEIAQRTYALKVPGGVLVRYQEWSGNSDSPEGEPPTMAMVFIPKVKIEAAGGGWPGWHLVPAY